MQKFIISFAALLAVANAGVYGPSPASGYGALPASYSTDVILQGETVVANIPPPAYWNSLIGGAFPESVAVNAKYINGPASIGSLSGISSRPEASAIAASASQPLPGGKYTLRIVPSWEVADTVVKVPEYVPSYAPAYAAAPAPIY